METLVCHSSVEITEPGVGVIACSSKETLPLVSLTSRAG
jgi:hypothetical protein